MLLLGYIFIWHDYKMHPKLHLLSWLASLIYLFNYCCKAMMPLLQIALLVIIFLLVFCFINAADFEPESTNEFQICDTYNPEEVCFFCYLFGMVNSFSTCFMSVSVSFLLESENLFQCSCCASLSILHV